MRPHDILYAALVGAVVLLASGCTQEIRLDVMRPARIDIPGVRGVAVLDFEGEDEAARVVRGAVMEGLRDGGRYEVHDLGGKVDPTEARAEAVVSGRVWWTVTRDRGTVPVVSTDVEWERSHGRRVPARTRDRIEEVTWRTLRVVLKVEIRFIRLAGDSEETVTTRTATRSGSWKSTGGLPDPDRLLREYAGEAVQPFVRRVSPYPESVSVPLEGVDSEASDLIAAGEYGAAIDRLEAVLGETAPDDRPPVLYDLGLAYEARGTVDDLVEAVIRYRRAALASGKPLHSRALARAERLVDETLTLRRQEHEAGEVEE